MKTVTKLFIILLFAFSVRANAQISLSTTYPTNGFDGFFESVYLKHSGFKFVYQHSDTLSLYNINLSLFENIKMPSGAWGTVQCMSEGLFDTDTLHIDYMIATSGYSPDSVVIYKDNGNIVFRNDSAQCVGLDFPGVGSPFFYPIIPTDSGTFMSLIGENGSGTAIANQLYKLPGSLPCVPGCLGSFATAMPQISNNANTAMKAYPNPAISYTNIYYTLPAGTNQGELVLYDLAGRELKKYTVTSQVDHLRLTTLDIAAGTYFYQLIVNGSGIATKKIVVVK